MHDGDDFDDGDDDGDGDDIDVNEDDVKKDAAPAPNVPVRSKRRIVPSVKPAITNRPDDVMVIDVHSSLMGNDDDNAGDVAADVAVTDDMVYNSNSRMEVPVIILVAINGRDCGCACCCELYLCVVLSCVSEQAGAPSPPYPSTFVYWREVTPSTGQIEASKEPKSQSIRGSAFVPGGVRNE